MHSFDTADERDKVPGGGIEFPNFRDDATMEMRDPYASEELQPSALRQMQYNSDFSQDINMKMRMPTKLTVASTHDNDEDFFQSSSRTNNSDILSKMEVPDRIVVSVGEEGAKYSGAQGSSGSLYAEDFLRQPQSSEHLSLVTPPRKLTLAERNLDALDPLPQQVSRRSSICMLTILMQNDVHLRAVSYFMHQILKFEIPEHEETQPTKDGTKASSSDEDTGGGKVEPLTVENQVPSSVSSPLGSSVLLAPTPGLLGDIQMTTMQFYRRVVDALNDERRVGPVTSTTDTVYTRASQLTAGGAQSAVSNRVAQDVQQNESFEELDDVSLLRRQIFKLHRRITAIEKQQTERSKRDIYVYAVTIAFWVFNGWFMYSSRRPY